MILPSTSGFDRPPPLAYPRTATILLTPAHAAEAGFLAAARLGLETMDIDDRPRPAAAGTTAAAARRAAAVRRAVRNILAERAIEYAERKSGN